MWICLALATGAAACGGAQKSMETLNDTVRAYNEGVRWGRFTTAAAYIPAAQRAQRVDEWDQRAKDVDITDYEILNVVTHGDREAKVEVKMSWYKESEGTLHETNALQTWEKRGKAWLMVDEARLRGTEMPGLPEPAMKD
jgi:hypothetical protein